jgi:hypothetical protein
VQRTSADLEYTAAVGVNEEPILAEGTSRFGSDHTFTSARARACDSPRIDGDGRWELRAPVIDAAPCSDAATEWPDTGRSLQTVRIYKRQ